MTKLQKIKIRFGKAPDTGKVENRIKMSSHLS